MTPRRKKQWRNLHEQEMKASVANISVRLIESYATRLLTMLAVLASFINISFAQQSTASLRGRVADELDGLIVGASVTLTNARGLQKSARTDERGEYLITGVAPGKYVLQFRASGFALYEKTEVEIPAGVSSRIDVSLRVELNKEEVAVGARDALSMETGENAGAIVFSGAALDALPDDPSDLAAVLQTLAGAVAGPEGGQIFIDGFANTGQPLPPTASIREVRINQNPFSAENDRLGFGQIQILTRPGTDRLRGEAFFGLSDESLNSRNPFAQNRAPYQTRLWAAQAGGPVIRNKATFFFNFERRETDDNAVINATVLDPALRIVPLQLALLTPQRRTTFGPRFDYQLNKDHTLSLRYSLFRFSNARAGIGGFSLPEAAYRVTNTIQTFQATETAVMSARTLNELRFQYIYENQVEYGDNSRPTVNVLGAFSGGGTGIGLEANPEGRLWLQDNVTHTAGAHIIRAGARLRLTTIKDISTFNFGGAFVFSGGLAPQLDERNEPVLDAAGQVVLVPITSIERYRRTLLFQGQGFSPALIRALGGGATQFSITGGDAVARARQFDFGAFIQDDWRVRSNFSLSLGLRYESQTNVNNGLSLAPRISFAWAPIARAPASQPQMVVRGGFGIFYDRFNENFVATANRYNGITQQQFVISDPAVLDFYPRVPPLSAVNALSLPQTIRRISTDIHVPYTLQSALSIERQLPYKTTLTVTYVGTRTLRALRSRNVNAPLPETIIADDPASGVRPVAAGGNILQFESTGRINQNQLIVAVNNRYNDSFSFFLNYTLGRLMSDTEGLGTFPASSYDLSTEYSRASQDARHSFSASGNFNIGWGIRLSPLVIASSGRPFNIITGRDANNDTLFTDRPALATDLTKAGVIVTRFGAFDPNPERGQAIIPRNFGHGPSFFVVNLNASRTFNFNTEGSAQAQSGARREARYGLTLTLRVQNLFNRTNGSTPVGNLSSSQFGQSVAAAGSFGFSGANPSAGNRRIEAQLRLTF